MVIHVLTRPIMSAPPNSRGHHAAPSLRRPPHITTTFGSVPWVVALESFYYIYIYLQENRASNFWKFPAFVSLHILEYPRSFNSLDWLETACWYWPLEYSRIVMKFQGQSFAYNCKLVISRIFLSIQAANIGKLLLENPTSHADSRTFKNIQGVYKTLDILGIA